MRQRFLICIVVALAVLSVRAQLRKPCDRRFLQEDGQQFVTRGVVSSSSVSALTGKHRVPVVLAEYPDVPFSVPDIAKFWDAMLNQPGYNERGTAGSLSEYFKVQSGGLFDLTFDVLGPVTLPDSMRYYGRNTGSEGDDARPEDLVWKACKALDTDFSPYDWDGDGVVDVVLVVYAGIGENRNGPEDNIWPHMSSIYGRKVGNLSLRTYACVSELCEDGVPDGYGTLCHEFSHSLGLPDLYPISGDEYSIFDEWDLMDGGNYANNGCSPPHYSALERYLCGWFEPIELNAPTSIVDMPSMDEMPVAYIIRNDANSKDYYILENRQQRNWDAFIPGNGLLVTHVKNYARSLFPNTSSQTQVGLVAADNRTYLQSRKFFGKSNKFDEFGRNHYLSLASYPYVVGDSVNNHLTEASIPAMTFAGKPVTNISMSANGKISFDFMKTGTSLHEMPVLDARADEDAWYDLQGRRVATPGTGLYIVKYKDGTVKKVFR